MRSAWIALALSIALVTSLSASAGEPQKARAHGFARLDANHDGKLTRDEVPKDAPDRLKAMLRKADRNDDQVVSQEEWNAVAKRHPKRSLAAKPHQKQSDKRGARFDQLFGHLDVNHDQVLSKGEFKAALAMLLFARSERHRGHDDRRAHFRPDPWHHPGRYSGELRWEHARYRNWCGDRHSGWGGPGRDGWSPRERFSDAGRGDERVGSNHGRPRRFADPRQLLEQRFKAADKSRDGKLSREETFGPLALHFDRIDANDDSQLSLDEIRATLGKLHQKPGAREVRPKQPRSSQQDPAASKKGAAPVKKDSETSKKS